jgi:hypothetical protein
MWVSA